MKEIEQLLQSFDVGQIILLFLIFVSAIFGIMDIVKKVKGALESYYQSRSSEENKDKTITDRLDKLEKSEEEDKAQLKEISNSIEELRKLIMKVQENQDRSNVATARSAMYRLSSELINKKWMSQSEYDTLYDLADVYKLSCKEEVPSLVKRALMLPVLTDEEIRDKVVDQN